MSSWADSVRMIFRQPRFPGLLAANLALGMAYSFVVPFMSMWGTHEVQMSPFMFGTFMTITAVSSIVLSTLLARWSDTHVSRRTMLILGSLGGLVGYLGYAFVRDPLALTVIGSLGLGVAAVNFSQLFAHVREEFDRPENAGVDAPFLMSVLRVSFSLAWTFGPAVGAKVMELFGYRGIFVGASSLFFLFLLGILRYVPQRAHAPAAREAAKEPLLRVLTRGEILASFIAFVLVFSAHAINLMNMPLMVTEQLGGTASDVGIIYTIAPFAEIPIMLWSGRAAAKGKQLSLLRLGAAATVAYFLALTFVSAPWHIYPMQILSAVSIAILTNITILFFQDLVPNQPGVATSIFSNSFNTGNLLGYFGFGLMLIPFGHRGIFIACAGFSLVTLIIMMFFKPRPRRSAHATTLAAVGH
jgi:MFS transporter, SET family, sugar efflux transporter